MPYQFNICVLRHSFCCTCILIQHTYYFSYSLFYINRVNVFGPSNANRKLMTLTGSLSAYRPFPRESFCCQVHSHVRDLADPDPGSSSLSLPTCMFAPWAPSLETSSLLSSPPSSICGHHCGVRDLQLS